MAKNAYKIPTSLNRSFLDHEITLSGGGFQGKPLPLKVMLFWAGSVFTMMWLLTATFLKNADWWLIILVAAWWLAITGFLGGYSKTKELTVTKVPALLNFLPRSSREVVTRRSDDPSAFYSITGLTSVDDSGYIVFGDGTVGQAYLVVGSASILVFEQDKRAILDRVDAFYRKIDTGAELIWLTTKEPQRIHRQLAHLDERNIALTARDPELIELMEETYSVLTEFVGGSFNSIHQYLLIKADSLEALKRMHTVVRAEADESALMIRQLSMLEGPDALDMLKGLYTYSPV